MVWLRRISGLLIAAAVVLGVAAGAVYAIVDPARLVQDAADRLDRTAGLKVTSGVEARWTLSPWPGIRIEDVTIRGHGLDLAARSAIASPDPVALLNGTVRAGRLTLQGADIRLDGATRPLPNLPELDVHLLDTTLTFAGAKDAAVIDLDARITLSGNRGPFSAQGTGTWKGVATSFRLNIDDPARANAAEAVKVGLSITAPLMSIEYDGTAALPGPRPWPLADGRLTLRADDPAAAAEWLGLDAVQAHGLIALDLEGRLEIAPDRLRTTLRATADRRGRTIGGELKFRADAGWMDSSRIGLSAVSRAGGLYSAYFDGTVVPAGTVEGRVKMSVLSVPKMLDWLDVPQIAPIRTVSRLNLAGALDLSPRTIDLRDADIQLDDQALVLSLGFDDRADPLVTASVMASGLDLPADPAQWVTLLSGWPDDVETRLELDLTDITLGRMDVARAGLTVTRKGQSGTAALRRVDVFDGTVAGEMTLTAEGPAPEASATLNGADLDLGQLAKLAGWPGALGSAGGQIRVSLLDPMATAWAERLKMTGEISVFRGALPIGDLAHALKGGPDTGQTAFASLTAKLASEGGLLTADPATLDLGDRVLSGKMQVDLRHYTLAATLTEPDVPSGLSLSGPLDTPAIRRVAASPSATDPNANTGLATTSTLRTDGPDPDQPNTAAATPPSDVREQEPDPSPTASDRKTLDNEADFAARPNEDVTPTANAVITAPVPLPAPR